jgi:hypothetical protein
MREKISRMHVIWFAIITAGLLLTVTRQTIFIAIVQLVLFASFRKRPVWAVGALALMACVFITAMFTINGFPAFVWGTLSFQESSTVSHVNDWVKGLVVFAEHPWGSGIGTADQSAVRAGLKHLTGDDLYLKYAVELGVAGLAFFVLILVSFAITGIRLYRRGLNLSEQRLGMTMWLATIGIAVNGITAVVFNSISLGWIFFWLAGAAATAQAAASAEAAVQLPPVRRNPAFSGSPALQPVSS